MQRRTMQPATPRDRLFEALPEDQPADQPTEGPRSMFARTGILPSQAIRAMISGGEIMAAPEIEANQIQPASLDLRLGKVAYRIRASFLPGPDATVRDKLDELKFHEIDLTKGAVLEAGCVYLVPLIEQLKLRSTIAGFANPKSSTGRLDVFTRLIADRQDGFDTVDEGYAGPLFAEICPRTFSIKVRYGSRLNQIRFRRRVGQQLDAGEQPGRVGDRRLREIHSDVGLVEGDAAIRDGLNLRISLAPIPPSGLSAIARAVMPAWSTSMRSAPTGSTSIGKPSISMATAASCSTRTSSTSSLRRRACRCRRPMSPRWRRSIR